MEEHLARETSLAGVAASPQNCDECDVRAAPKAQMLNSVERYDPKEHRREKLP